MILNKFPDLKWLQAQARTNFQNLQGANGTRLLQDGWPNVVLHTTTDQGAERRRILAPFSLFANTSGSSTVLHEGQRITLGEETFCLINKGQEYDLLLPKHQLTTTFNIHFGQKLYEESLHTLLHTEDWLLDHPEVMPSDYPVFFRSHWKNPILHRQLHRLERSYKISSLHPFPEEEEYNLLGETLEHLWQLQARDFRAFQSIRAKKLATRKELTRRLFQAADYLHDHYAANPSLEVLCRVATLSKFHFLRSFKLFFGCTPHQYLIAIRLQKAVSLLRHTQKPVFEIASELGFGEAASFVRAFKQKFRRPPAVFRSEN